MEWHINDLSLSGQYADPIAFRGAIEPLMQLRLRRPELRGRIFCSRSFSWRLATRSLNVQQAIRASRDPNYIRLAIEWLAKSGPFWDEDRAANREDYFHFEGEDVTDQGLGEAARRKLLSVTAHAFSFRESPIRFDRTPLRIEHGLPEEPLGRVDLDNFWQLDDVETADVFNPSNWLEMLTFARTRMPELVIASPIESELKSRPFHSGVCRRILELLSVLRNIVRETRDDSSLTSEGIALIQKHFVGDKAWFTDESDRNKDRYQEDLTFPDPEGTGFLFCPFHGKVKIEQFRIHFEWQRPLGQKQVKVVYIGPKITRD